MRVGVIGRTRSSAEGLARKRLPEARFTTFSFTLEPKGPQVEALRRHVGAARFAFNQCLRIVKDALEARKTDHKHFVPWTGFDLIKKFNAWKMCKAAGGEGAEVGLPWRNEVSQQVFEEEAVNLGRALEAFSAWRNGERRGRAPGFPKFKKRATSRPSFRMRNKGKGARGCIRLGDGSARIIRLPSIGIVRVRECTRDLRRMLSKGRAKILFVTVSLCSDGRWRAMLNVQASPLHPAQRHPEDAAATPVGIDRGLTKFAVLADKTGRELERIEAPRPLRESLSLLQRKSKEVSRKKVGSRNRERARRELAKTHARISFVRRDFVHRLSSRPAKTHGHLVIEDLCTNGLMKTRLARAVADSAWSLFATMLKYKASWYRANVTVAYRFFPSTRRCSAYGDVGDRLDLSKRTFHCSRCGHEADRDTNAAVNLANYLSVVASGWPHVAAKQAETINGCGGDSSDAEPLAPRETTPTKQQRPMA